MYIHKESPENQSLQYLHPPTPESGICFHLNTSIRVLKQGQTEYVLQPQAVVVGPQTTAVIIESAASYTSVRVGLLPGALYRLTGIAQSGMVNASFDAELIFGKEMVLLNHALCRTESPKSVLDLIEQFLLRQVSNCLSVHPLDIRIFELWLQPDPNKIGHIAAGCGLSLRQFERISLQRLGIRPKLYGKIIRFSKAYAMAERRECQNWTDLAYHNNYYDSRHLKKDFKNFTGKNLAMLKNDIENSPLRVLGQLPLY